ncbi:type I-E CRISPR-associated protein Cas6/Cse3/CasE [Alloalcanivorax xenomutans]|uniref:type I-E CRISPR-associated protein Cas6/Cse3/CasE n=1 Tax=Alloalcanivorax xenomutans TaxID=1094342 RepID=UPI001F223DD3|nr:type I-E CRISPR-associated protein Cas6/Cse3/CasE [Alloalcanivorax xenomutans]MCE7522767.1 type I-E CRISPR-associated protein Cas6/Cse3/CasE [Alloalcanivorax xenomutans]
MTMIASVLHLDRRAVKALRITDAYSLHRVVYSLYEDIRDTRQKQASTASGILYADQGGDVRGRKILMLANREPMDTVEAQHGEVRSKPIPDDFLEHEQYRFKVIVNPTRRDSASRKLLAARGREEVAQWFTERAHNSWGFEVAPWELQVDKIEVLKFKDKQRREVTIGQAHVQGMLRVIDKERFANSFTQGIGRARAYGCGLLQIVPVIENPFD